MINNYDFNVQFSENHNSPENIAHQMWKEDIYVKNNAIIIKIGIRGLLRSLIPILMLGFEKSVWFKK